ncbi:TPA: phage tail protein [Staphylococcus pseudintermedius]|nr:phage tail protein [Staphylococcus pseudintermedius]
MIHVLNFNSQIIDFISRDDNAVTIAKYHKTKDNDLLDIRILSQRAEHFKKRNRIIIQDKNGVYREYIIDRAEEDGRYVDVECTASHLVDISTSKPIPPGKYEKMTINQKLSETLRDSGWVVGDCDYAGLKTNSWTSVRTPLEMISQLETAHEVQADYEIEIDGYEVVERRVNMKIPAPLFKGKEIEYGKDLLSMKRVIDFSEVKTALFALGPEPEQGKRVETFVYDDEAQEQFDLPYRYIWGVYEPETEDDNMSLQRLTTLAKTELNKRKSAAVSYEISVVDIEKEFPHEVIRYGDIVRIKNPDFTPTLYAESEVVGIEHDLISNKCTYEFGKVVEYQEDDLLRYFRNRLGYFNQKFNDKFSNVNTIVRESLEGELQYFERKILKGDTPPDNPVNDMLWLDTSNPKVAVLRRYWNGKWIKSSAENAEDVGAFTREQALYSELSNTFVNLTIQHSRLMHEVSDVLESEYLIDTDIKEEVNSKLNDTIGVFNTIKSNLDSMTEETATIGALVDTQALFLDYRAKMQALYNTIENAKIAIDERFKLLQSQYTDEKFNDAMTEIANALPNGHWNPDTKQLTSDIPNKDDLEQLRQALILKQNEGLGSYNQKLEELQKEFKNLENGMELAVKKTIKEINGSGNLYRYSSPMAFKEANYYKADVITTGDDKLINYRKRYKLNFGALNYYKWEVNTKYTFSFTIKTDTDGVVIDNLNDGYYDHSQNISIPKDTWVRKSITFTPTYYLSDNGITLNLKKTSSGAWYSGWIGGSNDIENVWVKEFQLEKGEIDTGQKVNTDDEQAVYDNINTKITEHSTKIQAFEDKINLKTYREEITQTLNQQLEPLKNDIKQQNSQIALLPDKLTETVSKKIYETTISGLVKRLEAEEAKRETLSNKINDTVSIQQYQAGIQEAKEYADEQLEDVANNPGIKAGIQKANEEAQESLKEYVRAQDTLKQQESQAYIDGQISAEEQRAIEEARQKLAEAKRHAEDKANEAQRLSNSYTDSQIRDANRERDQILTRYDSQIQQNGREIALRTTKQEFNATNRTLSNIMSEIVQNVTTGATIRFDDNGTAQSLNVGPQGIQLNGDKINLNASRQFNLLVSDMRNKVDKNSVVSSINASPERIDINTQNIGIRGGSGQSYVDIRNDQIELGGGFRRTWRGRSTRHNIFTRLKDGHLRFRNNALDRSLYMSEFGISTYIDGEGEGQGSSGTIQWWDTTYSQSNANGITINSYGGVVALSSDTNRIVLDAYASSNVESKTAAVYIHPHKDTRPGKNRFAFTVSNADHSSYTDGYIMYGSDTNYNYGAGLRFSKSQNGKTVQVVDGNYSTGGDTTIEAGYGSFNTISKRDGNRYVRIISDDGFLVGRDNAGNRIASKFIYNRTYSGSPNLHITGEGTLGRSTSAMKYKALIEKQFDDNKRQLEHSQHILDLDVKSWFDKHEVENYAREIVEGEKLDEDKYKISRHVGLIAEDLAEAGLIEHVVYGSDGEIEGIEYDRLWIHLLPVIKELKNRIKVLEEKQNESK